MKKLKLLLHTDAPIAFTGFGRFCKALLTYLYKTQKYELVNYACGINDGNPELMRMPWRTRGALPNDLREMEMINRDPALARDASYGSYNIDKVILEEKPDIYIAAQDPWSYSNYLYSKWWYNKIPCVSWLTIDSKPLIPTIIEEAKIIKNLWFWSNFGVKEMHELGHTHVKCVHGCVDDSPFYRLPDYQKKEIRKKYNIDENTFIPGFLARNQIRKQFDVILHGYKIWKKNNPTVKSALLLHTSYQEGWNINRLADEYGVNKDEILTVFICRACKNYEVKKFTKHEEDCRFCGNKNSQITTNVTMGVSEEQLNEIYNIMDVYLHAISSGGLEVPCVQAKYVELVVLVTNFSCGEDLNSEGAASLPLDYSLFREHGTEFLKSYTSAFSVAKQLDKVFKMSIEERRKMGKMAREWAIKNYSVKVIGKQIEDFLDSCEITNYDFSQPQIELKNPSAQIPNIEDNKTWIKTLYKEILKMDNLQEQDEGLLYWLQSLSKGMKREEVENYFRGVAQTENNKNSQNKQIPFEDVIIKNGKKNLLLIVKESIGDILYVTALLDSWRKSYPAEEWNIYLACDPIYYEVLDGVKEIDKIIPYAPFMDNEIIMTGQGKNKKFFDSYCNICASTQKFLNYLTHENINLELKEEKIALTPVI